MFFQVQTFEANFSLVNFIKSKSINIEDIDWNLVFVNGQKATKKLLLTNKDLVQIFSSSEEKKSFFLKNSNQIIHWDDDFLIVNKPSGFTSHPDSNNLQNNVLFFYKRFLNFKEQEIKEFRPIVHRLDKATTGIMILARNLKSSQDFVRLFRERKIEKRYYAFANGTFSNPKFIVNAPIFKSSSKQTRISFSGREAITNFSLLKQYSKFALLDCCPITGRTHQIRKHLAHIGHPVLFDPIYFSKKDSDLFLHAYKLSFFWKKKNRSFSFELKVPQRFVSLLKITKNI